MTIPARKVGDRITLKDGSHWTITEVTHYDGTGWYDIRSGRVERIAYEDEIASPRAEEAA